MTLRKNIYILVNKQNLHYSRRDEVREMGRASLRSASEPDVFSEASRYYSLLYQQQVKISHIIKRAASNAHSVVV